jgi:ankyrin repeat protein
MLQTMVIVHMYHSLSYGADINLNDKYRKSPLFVALQQGGCNVVKCLLSSGADINLSDNYGQSPLFVASQQRCCDVVKCLSSGYHSN